MGPRLFSRGNSVLVGWLLLSRYRFNGAAALQPRKRAGRAAGRLQKSRASMGPRLFSRGNQALADSLQAEEVSFNGAAALQPRKRATEPRMEHG